MSSDERLGAAAREDLGRQIREIADQQSVMGVLSQIIKLRQAGLQKRLDGLLESVPAEDLSPYMGSGPRAEDAGVQLGSVFLSRAAKIDLVRLEDCLRKALLDSGTVPETDLDKVMASPNFRTQPEFSSQELIRLLRLRGVDVMSDPFFSTAIVKPSVLNESVAIDTLAQLGGAYADPSGFTTYGAVKMEQSRRPAGPETAAVRAELGILAEEAIEGLEVELGSNLNAAAIRDQAKAKAAKPGRSTARNK